MKRGPYKDLSGQRFYDFTILRMEITKKSGPHEYRAICRCEKCGTETDKRVRDVKNGIARCRCSRYVWQRTQQSLGNNKLFLGHADMPSRYLSNASRRAKEKSLSFDLDAEFLWLLYEKQNKRCALSGLPIVFGSNNDRASGSASLDRINNSGGYTKDNVQWLHKDVNLMKNVFDIEYFLTVCSAIAKGKHDRH
jgi:hypothetical protein